MIPSGFAGVENVLWLWMVAMIRPGAAFLAAPIFGAAFVPVQLRLIIALAVGIPALAATNFTLPAEGLASIEGFMLIAGEVVAGLAIGFAVQIGFSAAMVAGEVIGGAMGLSFAAMMDPATGQQLWKATDVWMDDPLVVGDLVLSHIGSTVTALDLGTGQIAWQRGQRPVDHRPADRRARGRGHRRLRGGHRLRGEHGGLHARRVSCTFLHTPSKARRTDLLSGT